MMQSYHQEEIIHQPFAQSSRNGKLRKAMIGCALFTVAGAFLVLVAGGKGRTIETLTQTTDIESKRSLRKITSSEILEDAMEGSPNHSLEGYGSIKDYTWYPDGSRLVKERDELPGNGHETAILRRAEESHTVHSQWSPSIIRSNDLSNNSHSNPGATVLQGSSNRPIEGHDNTEVSTSWYPSGDPQIIGEQGNVITESALAMATTADEPLPIDANWSPPISRTNDSTKNSDSGSKITVLQQGSVNGRLEKGRDGTKVYAWYVERPKNIKARDNELIETWKNVWRAYGYEPHVLGVDDAKEHPEILTFETSLDEVLPRNHPRAAEKRPCYLRYLAMAMQEGGGMMVDLDTTPSDIATVHEYDAPEKFSLYCQVDDPPNTSSTPKDWLREIERQYGSPCAARAPANEWLRVAKLAVWTTGKMNSPRTWTDVHSLERLSGWNEIDIVKDQRVRSAKSKSWDTCKFRSV